MSFNLEKIIESKRQFRRALAALPFADKLRIVEKLRKEKLPKLPKRKAAETPENENQEGDNQ